MTKRWDYFIVLPTDEPNVASLKVQPSIGDLYGSDTRKPLIYSLILWCTALDKGTCGDLGDQRRKLHKRQFVLSGRSVHVHQRASVHV